MEVVSDVVQGFANEVNKFIDAVDWQQRWLWGLGVYILLEVVIIILLRKNMNAQVVLLGWSLLQVLVARPLNELAHQHWKVFASANYFGKNGFFVSMIFGAPHILLGLLSLLFLLIGTAQLAAVVKRMQFRNDNKKQK